MEKKSSEPKPWRERHEELLEGHEREVQKSMGEAEGEAGQDNAKIDKLHAEISNIIGAKETKEAEPKPHVVLPGDKGWQKEGPDKRDLVLGPDRVGWEYVPPEKIKLLDLSEFVGRPVSDVIRHVIETYSATHYIPSIEGFMKWADAHSRDKDSPVSKENSYYFMRSIRNNTSDRFYWSVPFAQYDKNGWGQHDGWLNYGNARWNAHCRVVLIEK